LGGGKKKKSLRERKVPKDGGGPQDVSKMGNGRLKGGWGGGGPTKSGGGQARIFHLSWESGTV